MGTFALRTSCVVKTANTVDGKLVAIPQEIVANGLFVNEDMFKRYKLKLPETPEDDTYCWARV